MKKEEKTETVTIKMTSEQREELKNKAHENRMNVSEFIRFKTLGKK